jgi:hypothetical protein
MGMAAAFCLLAGCSNRPMQADDLRAEIKNAAYVARECSLLLELRSAGKTAERFRKVHEYYLTKQIEELEKNVEKQRPEPGSQAVFEQHKAKLAELKSALSEIESIPDQARFEALQRDLEALERQL